MDFDKLEAQAQLLRDGAQRQLDIISRDSALSPEGKRARMAQVVGPTAQRLEQLRAQALNEAAAERRRLEEAVWASPTADTTAWRDAQARVDALGDGDSLQAQELYRRASLSGDRGMQKAIWLSRFGHAAGDDVPVEWQQAAEALGDHDSSYGLGFRMNLDMICSPPVPPELAGVSSYDLDRLGAEG